MKKRIEKFDKRGNRIYYRSPLNGIESWSEYDESNNCIYCKHANGWEYWQKYDENNNCIYYKTNDGRECWYQYDEYNKQIMITEQEFNEIEFRAKEKEYNSRTKCSRFEIMDI